MIRKIPRLVGVQSAACAPLYWAFRKGWTELRPLKKRDRCEGIAIAEPVRGRQILEAIHRTDGEILAVTEKEIGWPEGNGPKRSFHRAHLRSDDCWIEEILEEKEQKGNRGLHVDGDGFEICRKNVIKVFADLS